jgi:hypothetical protein
MMRVRATVPRIIEKLYRAVNPITIDLRKPIDPNLRIGPLTYTQWNQALKDLNLRSHLFTAYQLDTLDKILAFSQSKAKELGMDQPMHDWKNWSDWKPNVEPWEQSVLQEIMSQLIRHVTKKHQLVKGKKFYQALGVFLDLRVLVAKVNVGDNMLAADAQIKLSNCNHQLKGYKYPFRVSV